LDPTGLPSGYMRPVMFCQNNLHWDTAANTWLDCGTIPNRQVNFLYEQDCTYDSNRYFSWYIFKVPVSAMVDGNQDNMPELAVTFGDRYGDVKVTAMGVD
jgi:hypothetical protein